MSDIATAFQDHLTTLTANGGAPKGPSTWGEIWDANWNKAKLDTAIGVREPLNEALDEMKNTLAARTGKQFNDVVESVTGQAGMTGSRAWEAQVLTSFANSLPDEEKKALPFLDPQAEADRRAAKLEADAADVNFRGGYSGMAVSFAAQAARSVLDPINLAATVATLPLGGIGGRVTGLRGLLGFAGREAVANAAGQALQEPFVQAGRASLNLSYGLDDALGNIAFAGVAGAVLHPFVYLKAGAEALRTRGMAGWNPVGTSPSPAQQTPSTASSPPSPSPLDAALQAAPSPASALPASAAPSPLARGGDDLFADISPADMMAAARHAETAALVDGFAATPTDMATMAKVLPEVRSALDSGMPLPQEVPIRVTPPALEAHVVVDADGRSLEVRPVVVEASKLLTSNDQGFDLSLQPRDRTRAASDVQIREIAGNLNPERLGVSSEADRGAPIIGEDGMVESGNGRLTAIRMAYAENGTSAARYRTWLESQGVDLSGFKEPVLVRVRMTDLAKDERAKFVVSANRAATLDFSSSERALADAKMLSPDVLELIQSPADIGTAANRGFVQAFMKALPITEQASLVTRNGDLSSDGITRVTRAIVASAYGDSPVLARIAESANDEIKSISSALVAVAPQWAKLRAGAMEGRIDPDVDLTPHLLEAVSITANLRSSKQKVQDFLGQVDMLNPRDPIVDIIVREFYIFKDDGATRAASQSHITKFLTFYAQEAQKVTTEIGLDFGLNRMDSQTLLSYAQAKARKNDAEAATIAQSAIPAGAGNAGSGRVQRDAGESGGRQGDGGGSSEPLASTRAGTKTSGKPARATAEPSLTPEAAAQAARQASVDAAIAKYGDALLLEVDGVALPAKVAFEKIANTKQAGEELLACLAQGGGL